MCVYGPLAVPGTARDRYVNSSSKVDTCCENKVKQPDLKCPMFTLGYILKTVRTGQFYANVNFKIIIKSFHHTDSSDGSIWCFKNPPEVSVKVLKAFAFLKHSFHSQVCQL